MHRTACLFEVDCFESRHRLSDSPKMPLGFLNEVEQSVAFLVRLGQSRRERVLECAKRSDQVTPMVNCACRRAHAGYARFFTADLPTFVPESSHWGRAGGWSTARESCASGR